MPAADPSSANRPFVKHTAAQGVVVRHKRVSRPTGITITALLSPLIFVGSSAVVVFATASLDSAGVRLESGVLTFFFKYGISCIAAVATLAGAPFVYRCLRWRVVVYEGHFCWRCLHDFGTTEDGICPSCDAKRLVALGRASRVTSGAKVWVLWFIVSYVVIYWVVEGILMQVGGLPRWFMVGVPLILAAGNATSHLKRHWRKKAKQGEARRKRLRSLGRCEVCEYDLTSNVRGRCPEFGTAIERLT